MSATRATVIDGRAVAARVREGVTREIEARRSAGGAEPGLATVLVGDDPASHIYVRRKREACAEVGIASFHHELGPDATQEEVLGLVAGLNADARVHGVLVQLPLPGQVDADAVTAAIDPEKDVDGLTPANAGRLMKGQPGLVPCTPAGVIELLRAGDTELVGAEAVVVGRSDLVGRPLAALLVAEDATVTTCHSRTRDLGAVCRRADVLVVAAGRPRLIDGDMVREGATVIDVGTNRTEAGLVGDVDFESAAARARAITPVPGGVGPMTIAMLLRNTLRAAQATGN